MEPLANLDLEKADCREYWFVTADELPSFVSLGGCTEGIMSAGGALDEEARLAVYDADWTLLGVASSCSKSSSVTVPGSSSRVPKSSSFSPYCARAKSSESLLSGRRGSSLPLGSSPAINSSRSEMRPM